VAINEQALNSDEEELHQLGYAQELRRRMSGFSNFAVSFTIISILSGCLTLYGYGMNTGGPAIIVWGWPIVGVMTLMVGLAMAEVCSSYPTAGGLYYWSAKLAPSHGPAWSWFTGWFNFLGQVAVTAGIDFGAAFFINAFGALVWGWSTAHWVTILIYAIVLLVHGLLNQFGIRLVALLNDVSVWWHILGVLVIVSVLAFRALAAPVGQLRVRALRQRHRAQDRPDLHRADRPAAGPVHVHRVRRVRAHDRGNPQRRAQRPARHRDVHSRVAVRRLAAADRDHLRDPALHR
jgi:amino acid transporter